MVRANDAAAMRNRAKMGRQLSRRRFLFIEAPFAQIEAVNRPGPSYYFLFIFDVFYLSPF